MTTEPGKQTPERPGLFDDPRNVRLLIRSLYVVCIVLFVGDFFVHRHIDHPWERLFGFYGIFGFVAFVVLVLSAKELRKVLMRGEDYYDA